MKKIAMKLVTKWELQPIVWLSVACLLSFLLPLTTRSQSIPGAPSLLPGQTATQLPNGQWLLLGGDSAGGGLDTASIWNSQSNNITQLSATLNRGRAWHTATVLPDGLVLVVGGLGNNKQVVSTVELYDPTTQTFTVLPSTGVTPRARHTVTLLTDGHVLIAGGVGSNGQTLQSAELWDALDPSSSQLPTLTSVRRNHTATLLPDGEVMLWGGTDDAGNPLSNGELFDPATKLFSPLATYPTDLLPRSTDAPILMAAIPLDRSTDVPTESVISLRFSKPLKVETVNLNTVTLQGPKGIEKIKVVGAENGSLAFITPDDPLLPGSTYSVTINGAIDKDGLSLAVTGLSFTTQGIGGGLPGGGGSQSGDSQSKIENLKSKIGGEDGDELEWRGARKDGKPYSDWQDLPPLQAPAGETALAGQVLDLRGLPLARVKLELENHYGSASVSVETDETGRFLLTGIDAGWSELIMDGHKARRRLNEQSSALGPVEDHGLFEYGLKIKPGETLVLPFTIWLPKIDNEHAVAIPQKPASEFTITTPKIQGLELRLPANGALLDRDRKPVEKVSLTQIPVDRTPFPLPPLEVPVYFTAQPGGAYIRNPGGIGARIYYPNRNNELPGTRFAFWHYDPGYRGWYEYGRGTILEDGKQVTPDPGISIYEFTGGMYTGGSGAGGGSGGCQPDQKCKEGDPVDLSSGLFILEKTDLCVADGVMPISLTRTYRPNDTVSRAFGLGASHPYDMFLRGTDYLSVNLVLADGKELHYVRTSPGESFQGAVFEHTASQSIWHKSTITNIGFGGWDLKRKDGMIYNFPDSSAASRPSQAAVLSIKDRNGNFTTIQRDASGNMIRITSPSGRWLEFTYDGSHRITQAKDNAGRTVGYEYDANGRLFRVTDPNGGTNEYTYDTLNRMATIKDARGIVWLTNQYDTTGKVTQQTMIDGGIYQFNYTMSGSTITQTEITDPRGKIRRVTFGADGNILTDTYALNLPEEQVTTYNLEPGTNFRQSKVDPLGRTTTHTYDSVGNMLTMTRLAGTPDAVTTTYTYEPQFNQVKTFTDPLGHTTTFNYDIEGNLISITDPLNHTTSFATNATGQPASTTTALGQVTQMNYDLGDLVAITDPLGNATNRLLDSAGRLINMTDPKGNQTIYDYDALSRMTKVTDPRSGPTSFSYDPNSNLLSVSDAKTASGVTAHTYDNMDQLATRTDPILKGESYQYDLAGNMTQFTDRKNQVTTYAYDGLNRRTNVTYNDTSTTTYVYDKGNRLRTITDSIAGQIIREYDGLDRLTSETTPQGMVSYTYDAASRRSTMTVPGQTPISYIYDNANRLIQITQGASNVYFGYDTANRRLSLTLPNNNKVEYAYDAASRVTSITYKQNLNTVIGDLTYEYDKAGNRTKIGGSWARTGMPEPITTTSYDANNRQLTFGDKTLSYDDNGNLQSITDPNGTTLYSWNARNQLVAISGPTVNASFVYDGLGRREAKTINGSLTEFLYDGLNPVQESSGATILANILPGLDIDEFLTRTDVAADVASHFLTDALGSPIAVTDNAGAVQTEYTYEPFGRSTANGATNSNSVQYTGRENDGIGLYYYRARFYHPGLQRFLSEDPLFSPHITSDPGIKDLLDYVGHHETEISSRLFRDSTNTYLYVNNKPLILTDPTGLRNCCKEKPRTVVDDCAEQWGCRQLGRWYAAYACFRWCTCYEVQCNEKRNFRPCIFWRFPVGPLSESDA